MALNLLRGLNARHRNTSPSRRNPKSVRPAVEGLEGRQLLANATPYLLVNGVHATESQAGSTLNFTVSLSSASAQPVSVHYQTADRTAVAGTDYAPASGTLTFAPGQTSLTVPVSALPQATFRPTSTFNLVLSGAQGGVILAGTGNGTILDPPTVTQQSMTIADVSMRRGLGGSTTMTFTVSLAMVSSVPVSVTASTSDVTAKAGSDYDANSQVLTFAPGAMSMQFSVTIYGTSTPTPQEVFLVSLSGTTVPVGRGTAAGILNFGA